MEIMLLSRVAGSISSVNLSALMLLVAKLVSSDRQLLVLLTMETRKLPCNFKAKTYIKCIHQTSVMSYSTVNCSTCKCV